MNTIIDNFNNLDISNKSLTIVEINARIIDEQDLEIIEILSDKNLFTELCKMPSVTTKIDNFKKLLYKHAILPSVIDSIIADYINELIPPSVKGQLRGNKFNKIVKSFILNLNMDDNYQIQFEKNCPFVKTDEIPDWYITNIKTKRTIIGMNQIDLWRGGQQANRGSKYIFNNSLNNNNTKLLAVVCSSITIKTTKTKKYKLFDIGFRLNRLCYIGNLSNIITDFFNLKSN